MHLRIASCDLGKTSAGLVIARVTDTGDVELEDVRYVPHDGDPFAVFGKWYAEQDVASCALLAATGTYADELVEPTLLLPEDACQQAALAHDPTLPATLNLVSIGGRGYSALSRKIDGQNGSTRTRVQFFENDKCSSGTGENIQKIAGRFGLTIEQADRLAADAVATVPITARCSVFAKSEMTHYANEGKPATDLFRGYFDSVARNARALLARCEVDGPVVLIGGCAQIKSLRRSLGELTGKEPILPEHYLCFEAVGAALLGAAQATTTTGVPLPAEAQELVAHKNKRFIVLEPAQRYAERVTLMPVPTPVAKWQDVPAILGLDLGSTGAKAVLTGLATGDILIDAYDRTRGNPIEATQRLIHALLADGTPDVRAIGITGSGRQAVATLLRSVFPDCGRIVVQNEIVAHATAAIRCDPKGGEDMSVIEIGGQDAKYIRISGGRITESDMNKACSAGTGSFLEEQAVFYDVRDIDRFVALARGAQRPPDLGQMCTVYVADAASEALKDGFGLGDIFAGFQYSIIHNYLHRVMGQRTLGATIFFQGKPATNPSLAWSLAAVTGRDIVVPPNPGAMGAWGIGLCAIEQLGADALATESLAIARALDAAITARSEFQCRDKECQTLCPIERTTVRIGEIQSVALSGGACPRFEVATKDQPKLPKDAPNPFEERRQLLAPYVHPSTAVPRVAVPLTSALQDYLPWLVTVLREIGVSPRVLRPGKGSLAAGEQLCNSFDSCGPAKIAHAVCDTDIPSLFFPKIMRVNDSEGVGGETCVTEQSMPEMVQTALDDRGRDVTVIRPRLSFARGLDAPELAESLWPLADELGLRRDVLPRAIRRAAAAQRGYRSRLISIGRRAIEYCRSEHVPLVLVCGALHVVHDDEINASIPQLLRQNGALALPVDCFPIDEDGPRMPKIYWGDANRYLRAAAAARTQRDIFPLLVSSFGCGPASFTEQVFATILEGFPHTILESDGHGGAAGFVTRIQAFLRSVRQYIDDNNAILPDNSVALSHVEPTPRTGPYLDRDVRYVFLSSVDSLGDLFAAAYRSYGFDAIVAEPLGEETLALGRRDCSGKECLSYQMIWGAFRRTLETYPSDKKTRLVQIAGEMCRAGVFPVKDRINLQKMGIGDRVAVTSLKLTGGLSMTIKIWSGLTALDIVRQLYLYHLAVETTPGETEILYHRFNDEIVRLMEQPTPEGWGRAGQLGRQWRDLKSIISWAARAFADVEARRPRGRELRRVFASGDLLTKGNDFANGGAYPFLARKGLRILFEPTCDFIEFLILANPRLMFGRGTNALSALAYEVEMAAIRERLYNLVIASHPWLPMPDVAATLVRSRDLIDTATNGGAPLAVGSVLWHWDHDRIDGVVMASCWGCDSGLVEESLLRHLDHIPIYFHYDDGTPIDERRLAAFAFRLQQAPAREKPIPPPTPNLPRRGLHRRLHRLRQWGRERIAVR